MNLAIQTLLQIFIRQTKIARYRKNFYKRNSMLKEQIDKIKNSMMKKSMPILENIQQQVTFFNLIILGNGAGSVKKNPTQDMRKYRDLSMGETKKMMSKTQALENNFMGRSDGIAKFFGSSNNIKDNEQSYPQGNIEYEDNKRLSLGGNISKQNYNNRNYQKPWLTNANSNKDINNKTFSGGWKSFQKNKMMNTTNAMGSSNNRDFMDFDQYRKEIGNMIKRTNSGNNEISNMVKNMMNDSDKNNRNRDQRENSSEHQNSIHSSVNKPEGNLSNYEFGKVLGKGSYAVCTMATDLRNNKKVAIKTYEKAKLYNKTRRTIVEREIQVQSYVNHKNIIRLHNSIQTKNHVHLVMDLGIGQSLAQYVKNKTNRCLSEKEARVIFRQLIESVDYCHKHNIYHRDLKSENILIDTNQNLTLLDFGFAIKQRTPTKLNLFCGTPNYMPPEIILKKDYFGGPNDVWGLGVLLYRITAGYFPFVGRSDKELHKKIVDVEYTFSSRASQELKKLYTQIFSFEPSRRITCNDILNSEWLNM